MIKLNSNEVFVGYIKQLLKDFNLPTCIIGEENAITEKHFIDKASIYFRTTKEDEIINKRIYSYDYGKKYLNLTSNFEINNLIYDRDTHRYLGKYLRFLRDYSDLNLMSMYNCFDGETFTGDIQIKKEDVLVTQFVNNNMYSVYQVPISIQNLSIKIFNSADVEMCLYINSDEYYANTQQEKIYYRDEVIKKTYQKNKAVSIINYNLKNMVDSDTNNKDFILRNIGKAYLIVKVPKTLENSIVILEGNNFVDSVYEISIKQPNTKFTKKALAGETIKDSEKYFNNDTIIKGIIQRLTIFPQLFSAENATSNYLLGDRLVEYLTGNVITPLSEHYDIKRLHETIKEKLLNSSDHDFIYKNDTSYSVWTDSDSKNIINLINNNFNKLNNFYDILGYVDKDVEKLIARDLDDAKL